MDSSVQTSVFVGHDVQVPALHEHGRRTSGEDVRPPDDIKEMDDNQDRGLSVVAENTPPSYRTLYVAQREPGGVKPIWSVHVDVQRREKAQKGR